MLLLRPPYILDSSSGLTCMYTGWHSLRMHHHAHIQLQVLVSLVCGFNATLQATVPLRRLLHKRPTVWEHPECAAAVRCTHTQQLLPMPLLLHTACSAPGSCEVACWQQTPPPAAPPAAQPACPGKAEQTAAGPQPPCTCPHTCATGGMAGQLVRLGKPHQQLCTALPQQLPAACCGVLSHDP